MMSYPLMYELANEQARLRRWITDEESAVIEAAIAWRYQAHSQSAVDDALWVAVENLLAVRSRNE